MKSDIRSIAFSILETIYFDLPSSDPLPPSGNLTAEGEKRHGVMNLFRSLQTRYSNHSCLGIFNNLPKKS